MEIKYPIEGSVDELAGILTHGIFEPGFWALDDFDLVDDGSS